ncbi:Hypothetical protein FKW44_025145 [Caligus rogercresseyi]|uniref:Uncharacterized protein n=1 Tax=Caligus rogercresseyi TaxID=217165 RepID=A0A7T8GLC0_CALRO|nr:Hypothetical protein FKW44_025145 [Caligus rogercresseyi]
MIEAARSYCTPVMTELRSMHKRGQYGVCPPVITEDEAWLQNLELGVDIIGAWGYAGAYARGHLWASETAGPFTVPKYEGFVEAEELLEGVEKKCAIGRRNVSKDASSASRAISQ